MGVTPLKSKKDDGPAWWDKPLAVVLVLVFLAIIALFVMQYTGPATTVVP